eukprot:scaffold99595_cov18-Tisochrysis_lutea.AAC.1
MVKTPKKHCSYAEAYLCCVALSHSVTPQQKKLERRGHTIQKGAIPSPIHTWSLASHTRRILCIFPRATSASWVMPAQPSKAMASRRASRLRLTDCARQRSTAAWRVWAAHTAMAAAMRTACRCLRHKIKREDW